MDAQNFNSGPESPKMGDFQPQTLYFSKKIIQQAKIYGGKGAGGQRLPCPASPATTTLSILRPKNEFAVSGNMAKIGSVGRFLVRQWC